MKVPVVLLHGFMGKGSDWAEVGAALDAAGFEWNAPDLPAHGKTPPREHSYAAWNEWLLGLLAARGWEKVALVGYSLGGRVALAFALEHPEAVTAAVFESANPGIEEAEKRLARAKEDERRAEAIRRRGLKAFLSEWYSMPLFESLHRRPEILKKMLEERSFQDAASMSQVVSAMSPGRQPNLWPALPSLRVPSLWIAGALDPKYPPIAKRAAKLAHGKSLIMPFAGHNTHAERPSCFSAALVAFLRRF